VWFYADAYQRLAPPHCPHHPHHHPLGTHRPSCSSPPPVRPLRSSLCQYNLLTASIRSPHCVETVSSLNTISSLRQYDLFTASKRSLCCVNTISSLRQYDLFTASKRSLCCVNTISSLRQYDLFTVSKRSLLCVNTVSFLCRHGGKLSCMCFVTLRYVYHCNAATSTRNLAFTARTPYDLYAGEKCMVSCARCSIGSLSSCKSSEFALASSRSILSSWY
jgi:hypothetical protein